MSTPTNDEKRVLIAKACGWQIGVKAEDWSDWPHNVVNPAGEVIYSWAESVTDPHFIDSLPDYFGDLNVCAETEKVLTDDQWIMYCVNLARSEKHLHGRFWSEIGASADDRANALGQALNLWEP